MKELTITQTYVLEVSVTVHVPDDMNTYEVQEHFADFPINVTVESAWDETESNDVICDNDILVDSVSPHGLPLVLKDGELL